MYDACTILKNNQNKLTKLKSNIGFFFTTDVAKRRKNIQWGAFVLCWGKCPVDVRGQGSDQLKDRLGLQSSKAYLIKWPMGAQWHCNLLRLRDSWQEQQEYIPPWQIHFHHSLFIKSFLNHQFPQCSLGSLNYIFKNALKQIAAVPSAHSFNVLLRSNCASQCHFQQAAILFPQKFSVEISL